MSDVKVEKITFGGNTELLATKLDGIKIHFTCDVQGSKKPVEGALPHGVTVKAVPIRLSCNAASLMDALKFASGGQSYRVAIQSRIRRLSKRELVKAVEDKKALEFHMSDLCNPVRTFTKVAPKVAAKRAAEKMTKEERAEFMAMLAQMDAEEDNGNNGEE